MIEQGRRADGACARPPEEAATLGHARASTPRLRPPRRWQPRFLRRRWCAPGPRACWTDKEPPRCGGRLGFPPTPPAFSRSSLTGVLRSTRSRSSPRCAGRSLGEGRTLQPRQDDRRGRGRPESRRALFDAFRPWEKRCKCLGTRGRGPLTPDVPSADYSKHGRAMASPRSGAADHRRLWLHRNLGLGSPALDPGGLESGASDRHAPRAGRLASR